MWRSFQYKAEHSEERRTTSADEQTHIHTLTGLTLFINYHCTESLRAYFTITHCAQKANADVCNALAIHCHTVTVENSVLTKTSKQLWAGLRADVQIMHRKIWPHYETASLICIRDRRSAEDVGGLVGNEVWMTGNAEDVIYRDGEGIKNNSVRRRICYIMCVCVILNILHIYIHTHMCKMFKI